MVKDIDGIIWEADADTLRFSRVEGNVAEILGYSAEEWLQQPDFWQSKLHKEDAGWVVDVCREASRRREPHRLTYRMCAADGRAVWLQDNVTVQTHGASATLSGIMVDVTDLVEQRLELAALNAENLRYRALYDLVPVAIWEEDWTGVMDVMRRLKAQGVTDISEHVRQNPGFIEDTLARLQVLAVNQAAVEMFRARDADELIRRASEVFLADEPHSVFQTGLDAILRGEHRLEGKNRLRRLDGEEVHVMFRIALPDLSDPDPRVVICEMDISAERSANQRFELVSQATSDVIWDFDIVNDTLWASDGLQRNFGLDPRQMYTSLQNWTDRIHPDDIDRVLLAFDRILSVGSNDWAQEYRFRRGDGQYVIVRDAGQVLRNDAGDAVRMVGSMVDVTLQRQLEEQLIQSQKLEAIGKLTGGIAHDFNNLLTIILGSLEAIEERVSGDDVAKRHLAPALQAVDRSSRLISQLLSYARKQPLAPRTIDLRRQLPETLQMIRPSLGDSIHVIVEQQSDLWRLRADPGQFDNALLNLAINARDAMPDGGTLTIRTDNAAVDSAEPLVERGLEPGQYVRISVADTGHGMEAATRQKAFDPFFTTKEFGAGSGLGLSMVQGFARQSNGLVVIQSTHGEGTVVELYLPAAGTRPHRTRPADRATANPQPGAGRILLVEDQEMVRDHLVMHLEGLGFSVVTADCATAAIDILQRDPAFDLMITDIIMPGKVSGTVLAREVRNMLPDLPIRYMSGYSDTLSDTEGAEPLVTGQNLLRKPFRRQELAKFVTDAIRAQRPDSD